MSHSNWTGKIDLLYEYLQGRTNLKSTYHQAPFKLQRSFYPEGESICYNLILHTAGGIVGGDILHQNIHLLPHSKVFITTPSAGKIYRSNGEKALQNIFINLENDTYLEYFPQENIVFNHAQYQQKLRVNIQENSTFFGWEINRFGRSARGETFTDGQWLNYTEIWHNDKPLWLDRQKLEGDKQLFFAVNGLGGKPVTANLILISTTNNYDFVGEIKQLIREKYSDLILGVTSLQKGLLCRYHGQSVSLAKNVFIEIWQLLRQKYNLNYAKKPRFWV